MAGSGPVLFSGFVNAGPACAAAGATTAATADSRSAVKAAARALPTRPRRGRAGTPAFETFRVPCMASPGGRWRIYTTGTGRRAARCPKVGALLIRWVQILRAHGFGRASVIGHIRVAFRLN